MDEGIYLLSDHGLTADAAAGEKVAGKAGAVRHADPGLHRLAADLAGYRRMAWI